VAACGREREVQEEAVERVDVGSMYDGGLRLLKTGLDALELLVFLVVVGGLAARTCMHAPPFH
jgi:hypothetical protein